MSDTRPRPVVPEELPKILHDLGYAVIKNNPPDIISFAADYFQNLRAEKEKETIDGNILFTFIQQLLLKV